MSKEAAGLLLSFACYILEDFALLTPALQEVFCKNNVFIEQCIHTFVESKDLFPISAVQQRTGKVRG